MSDSVRCTIPVLFLLLVATAARAQSSARADTVHHDVLRRDTLRIDTAALHRDRAALIYGDHHALTIHAPDNWVLDTRSGQRQGLQAVFYPQGEHWAKSPAVMYCEVVGRGKDIRDLKALLDFDQSRYRNSSPTALVEEEPALQAGGRSAVVRHFSGGAKGTIESVAYIEERTVIVMVVLSCRTPEAYQSSVPAFKQLVGSYKFLADDQENILRAIEASGH
jgi:hypothetical protein